MLDKRMKYMSIVTICILSLVPSAIVGNDLIIAQPFNAKLLLNVTWVSLHQEETERSKKRSITGKEIHWMKFHTDGTFSHIISFPDNPVISPEHWTLNTESGYLGEYSIKGNELRLFYYRNEPRENFQLVMTIEQGGDYLLLKDKQAIGRDLRFSRTFKQE